MRNIGRDRRGSYAFGRFQFAIDGTLLERDGARVALAPKVLQTLLVLVERAGQVVKKADLLNAVWPDSFVEETGLSRNISLLRQALGDDAQALIATVARVGYRFAAAVERVDHEAGEQGGAVGGAAESGEQPRARGLTRLLVLPFRLLRDDPETGFLAFSVPDAVVNALSGLTSLVVRSRPLAPGSNGDGLDLKRIASESDVDAVLTGSLLRSGPQIRMSAQLLAVPCGTVLWSQSLQVTMQDLFDLQDRLGTEIVRSLSLSLTAPEQRRLKNDVPASPVAYEFFLRGNEAVGPQGIISSSNLRVARELYARALDEDPQYAPAWARLGRCHHLIGKADENREENLARAESCFQRALELSPDLPLADNLLSWLEIDQGHARKAMVRLVARGLAGSAQPELYAALVQACRFCGLLEASVAAHERARELDGAIATSGYQSLWQLGFEDRALREGVRPYLLMAIVSGMRGDTNRALDVLRETEAHGPTSLASNLIASIRAVFEGRRDQALEHASRVFEAGPDPEALYFAARTVAFFGEPRALFELGRALERGFVIYRVLLRDDPWLDPLRSTPEFHGLVEQSRQAYRECRSAYVDAGGERLLGPPPSPEELERRLGPRVALPEPGGSP